MQCDEICDPNRSDWRYTPDVWQWYAVGALGVVAFVSGIAFFLAVVRRRAVPAVGWLGIGSAAVATGIWAFWVNAGSDQELVIQPIFYVVSAAVLAAGVGSAALVRRPTARTG